MEIEQEINNTHDLNQLLSLIHGLKDQILSIIRKSLSQLISYLVLE